MDIQTRIQLKTAIVGGGASGLFLANLLQGKRGEIALLEGGERVGRKLSATGNGQGNVTNLAVKTTPYFSSCARGAARAQALVCRYDEQSLRTFFQSLGVLIFFDERGRGYPTGRQASSLTDALRFRAEEKGVDTYVNTRIIRIEKQGKRFLLYSQDGRLFEAERVALCTGGKAAKNFGTDGSAYALAQAFGHTLTSLYPSLVQLKTDTACIRTLKGIRVFNTQVTANWSEGDERKSRVVRGDIIFTDYGVSGDAVFRLSAFLSHQNHSFLTIDFLPDVAKESLQAILIEKANNFPARKWSELLCGIVNNQLGRAIMQRTKEGDIAQAVERVKAFPLTVQGTLGFDYAQVTKGGISMEEVDDTLQSKRADGLYFAGEILDIDGECGGFNLQWAYASACAVAAAIAEQSAKTRG